MGSHIIVCGFFFLTVYFTIASSSSPEPRCHPEERAALFNFFNGFQSGEPDGRDCLPSPSWNQSVDCCSWLGVECDNKTGRVIGVDLSSICLRGTLSSSSTIFNLRYLQSLDLSSINFQRSSIPKQIGTLQNLKLLAMRESNLTGSISSVVCNLKQLQRLDLWMNSLTGRLPICIFDLPDLQYLDLSQNLLKGSLPSKIYGLLKLNFLNLSRNLLNGKVPSWLFTIPTLGSFGLEYNNLTGPIESFQTPSQSSLTTVVLNNNIIRGSIPPSLFQLVNLTGIYLHDNQLSGVIKWSLFQKLVHLTILKLQQNRGLSLQNDQGSANVLPKLFVLDLSFCNLMEFPIIGNQSMIFMNVSYNRITGRILTGPYSRGGWEELGTLDASHNLITGFDRYPSRTTEFYLSYNRLQGPLTQPPDGISTLSLGNNQLTGKIPSGFCSLGNLEVLDLSFNYLTGVVPPCLVNSSLSLNLQGNQFDCSNITNIC